MSLIIDFRKAFSEELFPEKVPMEKNQDNL